MSPAGPARADRSGEASRRNLYVFNGGFITQKHVRRILSLAGYDLRLGWPSRDDLIAVWGRSPTAARGLGVATRTGAGVLHVEDALLRSIRPGRDGAPPLGLTIDSRRPAFDASGPSDLEIHLASVAFDDTAQLDRARNAMARIKALHLSKYNDFARDARLPAPGYVLVIDQTRDDASVTYGGATTGTFREMLVCAQQDHPGARIVVKSHPETAAGHRAGYFTPEHMSDRMTLLETPVSPQALMEGAIAVYTVTSGMGFEAIFAGHKPIVFGQPFYAGWGLTEDRQPIDRRQRRLTRAQLFAGVMMDYPLWYDPFRDRLCDLEQVIDTLEARIKAWRMDKSGYTGLGISLWKRGYFQKIFGGTGGPGVRFASTPGAAPATMPLMVWASKEPPEYEGPIYRVEDGFLRSRGLGADLIPPLSLVLDDTGIYYDPTRPSALERLITQAADLSVRDLTRAANLRACIVNQGLSKYNLGGMSPHIDTQGREMILVPGQVADDASILKGTSGVQSDDALLRHVRADFPDAYIVYKPHPDVEAGLRNGLVTHHAADLVAVKTDPIALLAHCNRVATMTSLLGFEAMLRNIPVTCYGAPFYAGWGLTDDRAIMPARRIARPTCDALIHATLIAYPRYYDPVTGTICPPEVVVERIAQGNVLRHGVANRALAKLQGLFASQSWIWRR